jgi:hypothetical protein
MFCRLLFIIALFGCKSQNKMFRVVDAQRLQIANTDKELSHVKYFQIAFADTNSAIPVYPIVLPKTVEAIAAIEELLDFQGDTRLCASPATNYHVLSSTVTNDTIRYYSLQVEALFLINQIFLDKPFMYAPRPVLVNKATKIHQAIDGELIKIAFRDYRRWFDNVKEIGFERARSENVLPLDNSKVEWAK